MTGRDAVVRSKKVISKPVISLERAKLALFFVSIRVSIRGLFFIRVNLRLSAVEFFLVRVHSRFKTACKVYLIGKDTDLGYFKVGPTLRTSGGNTDEAVISQTPRAARKRDS